MTKVQYLLKEINQLNITDLELILRAINQKIAQEKKVLSILEEYRGIGKGIWKMDAQNYINQARSQ